MSMSTSKSRASSKTRRICPGWVAVVAGRGADDARAVAQAGKQQLVRAGIVGEPFLREDAELDVDRPAVLVDERLDPRPAAQADAGIHLDMCAHARHALRDRHVERAAGAGRDVLDGELALHRRSALHRIGHALGFGRGTVENVRLVEVNVRLDETRDDEPAAGVDHLDRSVELGRDHGDLSVGNADVDHARFIGREPRIAEDELHRWLRRSCGSRSSCRAGT
jgi:hypothetical protein